MEHTTDSYLEISLKNSDCSSEGGTLIPAKALDDFELL